MNFSPLNLLNMTEQSEQNYIEIPETSGLAKTARPDEPANTSFSLFTEFDISLFKAGKHYHLYNKLGSHPAVLKEPILLCGRPMQKRLQWLVISTAGTEKAHLYPLARMVQGFGKVLQRV
jgi:hypothetical protein